MVLEADVAAVAVLAAADVLEQFIGDGEFAAFLELAGLEHFDPFRCPEVVFKHVLVVLAVDDGALEDDDLGLVPLAEGFGVLWLGGNHVVERGGLAVAIDTELGVHVVGVVEHLIFGAALPDGDVLFLAFGVLGLDFLCEVEDAGVAALGDLVFELEGEVLELVGEDEVAAAFYLGFAGAGAFEVDGAVFNIPAGGGFGHAVAAPTLEGLAVEEGDVAVGIGGGQFCLFVIDDGELGHAGLGGGVGATLAGAATAGAGAAVLLAARHHEQAGGSYNK